MKQFDVPIIYRSPLITAIKKRRKELDKLKKDFTPTLLDFGTLRIYLARHFGFCYGVENAIEIAFRTIDENPGKRIFLLSEMIHNPQVNADLQAHGIQFLQDTHGKQLISFDDLRPGDIVLIPAFGTTMEIEKRLKEAGIETEKYNTTCPFVERVWNRSESIAKQNYTIVIHGKPTHEETRATFSHASLSGPAVVVKDMSEAIRLGSYINGERDKSHFYEEFKGQYSENFDAENDLARIGVVNQTTMLASDTQAIADYLRDVMTTKHAAPVENSSDFFADTRDTLCYATNDNQTSVVTMLNVAADFAIIVGGYNSSNTSHLVELCEKNFATYFIDSEEKILSAREIISFDLHKKIEVPARDYVPQKSPVTILITSGASCPDALVEGVIRKMTSFFPVIKTIEEIVEEFAC